MTIELINTGTELMLGRILNSHQQWICRHLADLGYFVSRQVAVPDTGAQIEQAVRESLARADLVITTGGLGPTSDDITRDLIAKLLGRELREDKSSLDKIEEFFRMRGRAMPERTRVQAMVPEGALVLPNVNGTAPGLAIGLEPNPFRAEGKSWLIMLPGPPRELRPMFTESVVPLLGRIFSAHQVFVARTFRTTGIGESLVEEKIGNLLGQYVQAGLDVGYCSRPGQVDVRLSAVGEQAEALLQQAEAIVRMAIAEHVFASGDEELEQVIIRRLAERKQTLALAESCTGGFLAHRLTNVPGASNVLLAGLVTYSNQAKEKFLGVDAPTLAANGAVSEPVAREMAEGVRRETGAHFALSVTGIAGPGGGTATKPVGTVFIGLAGPSGTTVVRYFNPYDRETFKQVTVDQALELLRRAMT